MSTLKSKVILAKNINIDKNYINVLNYSESEMVSLVSSSSHIVASRDDYQFIRANGTIFVDIPYSTCLESNYIAFQNKDYSNKWFFGWIDDVIFNSDKNCEIKYTIDYWSTWFSYWEQKPCFVKREHVNDDTIGANTIDENLATGDYIQDGTERTDASFNEYLWIVIESEFNPYNSSRFSGVSIVNGQLQAFPYYLIKYTLPLTTSTAYANLQNFLLCVASGGGSSISDIATGNIEYIKNIFVVPRSCIDETTLTQRTISATALFDSFSYYESGASLQAEEFYYDTTKVTSYTNLDIKNNKCFCYPYNYLLVTNNNGNQNIFKYENFSTDICTFKFIGSVTIGASGKLIPQYYKGIEDNIDESLPLPKFPTFSWSSDAFTNWLTQNAVNCATSIVGLGGSATGYASDVQTSGISSASNLLGFSSSIASGVLNTIGAFQSAKLLPNIKGGQNTGDVSFSAGLNGFTYHPMRVKDENMKVIDDYFTRFGYKIDRVKTPNLTGRSIFNYVEIGENEAIGYGEVPSVAMETINGACRKGVTIWHNHDNIGNYTLDNSIV